MRYIRSEVFLSEVKYDHLFMTVVAYNAYIKKMFIICFADKTEDEIVRETNREIRVFQ